MPTIHVFERSLADHRIAEILRKLDQQKVPIGILAVDLDTNEPILLPLDPNLLPPLVDMIKFMAKNSGTIKKFGS